MAEPTDIAELEAAVAALDARLKAERAEDAAEDAAFTAELGRLRAELAGLKGDTEPVPEPPDPKPVQVDRWWERLGGPSKCGRPFRSGTFAVMGAQLNTWTKAMGYAPEIVGGNCRTYGGGDLADSWAKIVEQGRVSKHHQTKDVVLKLNGCTDETYACFMFATLPMGAGIDEMRASAEGKRADHHKRLGALIRQELEDAKRDPRLTIIRPDWEGWGQDTGRRIRAPGN